MAKIFFVSEKISETSWSLALAMKAQNNEIFFLTSRDQNVPDSQGIEILSYFRHWSLWEAFRFLPRFWSSRVEIVHFFLESDQLNPAQSVLSSAAVIFPETLISTSLMNLSKNLHRGNPIRYLIEHSDVVTAPTVDMLGQLRGLNIRSRNQNRGILPPLLPKDSMSSATSASGVLTELIELLGHSLSLVVPCTDPQDLVSSDLAPCLPILAKKYFLVFETSIEKLTPSQRKIWERKLNETLGTQWTLTGQLTGEEEKVLYQRIDACLLAGLNLTPMEIIHTLKKLNQGKAELMIDDQQSRLYPALWQNRHNCWIFPRHRMKSEIEAWISESPPPLPSRWPEVFQHKQEIVDAPLNELHRLYSRALARKGNS